MPASSRNPNVRETAARHLAKAMCRVHPLQRRELLAEVIRHAETGISIIDGRGVPEGYFPPEPSFAEAAAELIGIDLSDARVSA